MIYVCALFVEMEQCEDGAAFLQALMLLGKDTEAKAKLDDLRAEGGADSAVNALYRDLEKRLCMAG